MAADRIGDVLSLDSAAVDPVPDTLESPARDVLGGAIRLSDQILLLLEPERVALHEAQV